MPNLVPMNAPPPQLGDLAISAPLWTLLSSNLAAAVEIAEMVADDGMRIACKTLAPALAERARPCGEAYVREALMPLVVVYGISEMARASAFWGIYFKALADLPAGALVRGVEDYTKSGDAEFFPKPGPLRALALRHAEPMLKAAHRAKQVAAAPPPKPIEQTESDKEAVRRMLADYMASMDERRALQPKRPPLPPTPVAFAPGTHLSPAMIEAMRRQDPEWRPAVEVDQGEPDPGMFS